ncbi:MAG: MFS transporter [Bacillota bacterium]
MAEPRITTECDKIPPKEKLIFGMADFFGGGSGTMVGLLLLAFFNRSLGIEAGIASAIIMISKIWDAVSDPLMGAISDNTRTKWGRRRPYMFFGGLMVIPALAFLFAPISEAPYWLRIVSATMSFLVFCTVTTIIQVPYSSLSSDISPDHVERTKANSLRLIFSMVSSGICYLVPSIIFEMHLDGDLSAVTFFLIITFLFGTFFGVPLILAGIYTKERNYVNLKHKAKFSFKSYKEPFMVKSYMWHLLMYISAFICIDIIAALAVYYASDVLRNMTIFGQSMSMLFIIAPMMVTAGLMVPFVYIIARKKGKQFAFRAGMPFYIAGAIFLAVVPSSFPGWTVPLGAFLMGIGLGGTQMMPWIIFPDTIDVAELKLGYRPTGNFSGMMTFSRKLASGIAIAIVGFVLSIAGEIPGIEGQPKPLQPDSVLLAIRIMMGGTVALLISLALFASLKYKVSSDRLERIRYFLEFQRADKLDQLSEEEKQEREALIKELA